jgi:leader peptidase (prepilin peptidase)/N-methyltransferase
LPDWLLPVLVSPFIGSFLGVLIQRLPDGGDVVAARSRCNACQRTLGPADLIPLASYLATRGRCRPCGAPIGRFHLLVELAALAVAVWAVSLDEGMRLWADCVLGWTLLALGWIDARHMILPDILTLPLVLAGLGFAWFLEPERIVDHAGGAAIGWLLFWAVSRFYRWLRGRDGLGEGDAKLLGRLVRSRAGHAGRGADRIGPGAGHPPARRGSDRRDGHTVRAAARLRDLAGVALCPVSFHGLRYPEHALGLAANDR